jgi:hypothetical protein
MSTSAECRKYAKECVELAQTTTNTRHRTMLLGMAKCWLGFAEDAELRSRFSQTDDRVSEPT